MHGHTDLITCLAISPDGKWALTGSEDTSAILWDLSTFCSYTLPGHSDTITSIALTPNGKWALTGSKDKSAILWDLHDLPTVRFYELTRTQTISDYRSSHSRCKMGINRICR